MSLNVKMCNIIFEYDDKCKIVSNNVILCNVMWCGVESCQKKSHFMKSPPIVVGCATSHNYTSIQGQAYVYF